jgi:transcriptional regulator with XRE-family HTH domain
VETVTSASDQAGLGELLRQARVAKGMSQESLARELRLPLHLLNAIETEDWERIPPGRERPLTRLVARKVGLDLEEHQEFFEALPGSLEQEPPNPRRESLERLLMGAISVSCLAVMVWLLVPGRGLRSKIPARENAPAQGPAASYTPTVAKGPYPVLGEVLPEAPITEEGIRISLRAMDTCEAHVKSGAGVLTHSLRVSEPWRIRVKGPFVLSLDNAGVVEIEVAGQRIQHGKIVGESWSGAFGADGILLLPPKPRIENPPPTAPETEPEAESAE